MSTQHGGGARKPTATKATAGGKPSDPDKAATTTGKAATSTSKAATSRPAGKATGRPPGRTGGKTGGPRKPISPVKVSQGRSWGPIALFTAVAVIAIAIIGYGGWAVYQNGLGWADRASKISGIVDWRTKDPKVLTSNHQYGPIDYSKMPMNPPVGGTHNFNWQRCLGDVYDAPIATEHAIHSMEHGAVWITYKTSLPKDQVEMLAKRVRGNDFTLMSPYDSQDTPISLQTWGYQLKVTNASDKRIDEFLKDLRQVSQPEKGVVCSSGNMITETGTTPHDLGKDAASPTGTDGTTGQNGQPVPDNPAPGSGG